MIRFFIADSTKIGDITFLYNLIDLSASRATRRLLFYLTAWWLEQKYSKESHIHLRTLRIGLKIGFTGF